MAADRFHASFSNWFKKTGEKQVVIASKLGISPSGLNNILKKRAISLAYMAEIAEKIDMDLLDMLYEGRAILEGSEAVEAQAEPNKSQDTPQALADILHRLCAKDDKIERLEAENAQLKEENERLRVISGDVEPVALRTSGSTAKAKNAPGVVLDD